MRTERKANLMSPPACVGLFGPVVTFSLQVVLSSDVNLSTRVHII